MTAPYSEEYACDTDALVVCVVSVVGSPFVAHLMQGFNVTLFVYGQTAAGKTHTMTGNLKDRSQVQDPHCPSCKLVSACVDG